MVSKDEKPRAVESQSDGILIENQQQVNSTTENSDHFNNKNANATVVSLA